MPAAAVVAVVSLVDRVVVGLEELLELVLMRLVMDRVVVVVLIVVVAAAPRVEL